MAKGLTNVQAGRGVALILASMVWMGIAPRIAARMAHAGHSDLWYNLAAASLGVAGFAPVIILLTVVILRFSDDWNRHIGLMGYVISFVGSLLFFVAVDTLQSARVINPWTFAPVWLWLLIWWAIGLAASWAWHTVRR